MMRDGDTGGLWHMIEEGQVYVPLPLSFFPFLSFPFSLLLPLFLLVQLRPTNYKPVSISISALHYS